MRRPQRTRNGPKCADWVGEIKLRRRAKRQLPTLSGQRSFGARFALDKSEVGFRLPRRPTGRFGRAGRSLDDRHNHTQGPRERRVAAYAFMKVLALTEEQVHGLEEAIDAAKDPLEGDRRWAKDNPEMLRPWIARPPRKHSKSLSLARQPNTPYFEKQHDVLRAGAHSSGNRRTCRHPNYAMVRPSTFDFLVDRLS